MQLFKNLAACQKIKYIFFVFFSFPWWSQAAMFVFQRQWRFQLLFWTNTSTPSELVTPNIIATWILWFSYFFSILRTICRNFQFDSSMEGSLSKCLFETAQSASSFTNVDALKFQLAQYDAFYGSQIQQHSLECLMMLREVINKGSVLYCGSNDDNSTGVSLSEILLSFMLEKYIVCDACGLRSPSFESGSVLYITPIYTSSGMQELMMQGMQQNLEKSCFRCKRNTWHVESNHILLHPKYLIIVVNRFRYINNDLTKDRCSIPILIWTMYLVSINSACRLP